MNNGNEKAVNTSLARTPATFGISTYTDAEACDDGVLIALDAKDRVPRTVWEWLIEKMPTTSDPPNRWPIDLMGWCRASSIKQDEAQKLIIKHGAEEAQKLFVRIVADRKTAAMTRGLISVNRQQAERVYRDNTDGGIYKKYAVEKNGRIESLTDVKTDKTLWLIPNENGDITLMFPEDY